MSSDARLPVGFHKGAFLKLALPMIVSRAGLASMGIADGIMVARFQSREFAWLSLAEGTLGRLLDIGIAFLIGGLLLVPRHFAGGDFEGARRIWLRTVPIALAIGVAGLLIGLQGNFLLRLTGQKAELVLGAAPVMKILGAGYPAALLAIAAAVYLEGINRPQLVAACVVGANVLNVVFNWLFIGGHLGIAAMGARGSALSTTLVRCALGIALMIIAWRSRGGRVLPPDDRPIEESASSNRTQWQLSFAAAGSVAAMVVLGSSLTIFAGWLGLLPLAVFSAAWSLAAPIALIALGLADATGVYVASESGRAGDRGAAPVAWAGLRVTLFAVGIIALILLLCANLFARIYSKDSTMQASIASVIPVVALILLVDCAGFVMASSLRAIREAAWPAAIEIGAMVLLVPIAASLTFARGMGVRGLFLAMLTAGCVRTTMLAGRFHWRTTRATILPAAVALKGWSLDAE